MFPIEFLCVILRESFPVFIVGVPLRFFMKKDGF